MVIMANDRRSTFARDAREVAEGLADKALELVLLMALSRFVDDFSNTRGLAADYLSSGNFTVMHLSEMFLEPSKSGG